MTTSRDADRQRDTEAPHAEPQGVVQIHRKEGSIPGRTLSSALSSEQEAVLRTGSSLLPLTPTMTPPSTPQSE